MAIHTRRDLLRTSLLLGTALSTRGLWGATSGRTYLPGKYVLFVAGGAAIVESLSSTLAQAPVVAPGTTGLAPQAAASIQAPARMPGTAGLALQSSATALQISQVSFALGWGPPQLIANWVVGAVNNHAPGRLDGSVWACDFNLKGQTALDWTGGSITQVVWPACDAASIAESFPLVTLQAVTLSTRQLGGAALPTAPLLSAPRWRASDFRVTSNVDIDAGRIAGVSALSFVPAAYGGSVALVHHTETELVLFESALRTRNGVLVPGQSTNITVQYLVPNLSSILASVTLGDCRVVAVNNVRSSPNDEVLPTLTVTMKYANASLSIAAI